MNRSSARYQRNESEKKLKRLSDSKLFIGEYLHYKSCSSTQDLIRHFDADWVILRSDRQRSGRGRRDREWSSESGGLYYSLKFPSGAVDTADSILPLGAASVWCEVLEELFPCLTDSITIKWPNDLLLDERKLAGFLGEKSDDSVYLGVGVNVNNDLPDGEYQFPPINLKEALGSECSPGNLLMNWYRAFLGEVTGDSLSRHFQSEFLEKRINTIGETIKYNNSLGEAVGLCEKGELKVRLNGNDHRVHRTDDLEVQST